MLKKKSAQDFAYLFKKYRLRSEIETLSEFGDLFAQESMIYDNSLFTRWQTGERVPKDRKVLLALLRIFYKKGGIRTKEEANKLLETTDNRNLSELELVEFQQYIVDSPQESNLFSQSNASDTSSIFYFNQTSTIKKILITMYLFILIWWLRINFFTAFALEEQRLFSLLYALIPLTAGIFGLQISNSHKYKNSLLGKSILYYSLGLIALWFGQTVWSYYNIVAQIEVPYPSYADIGFFSIIPLYIAGSIYLGRAAGVCLKMKSVQDTMTFLGIPIIVFISNYLFSLKHMSFDSSHPIKLFLDILYPTGESITVSITLIVLTLANTHLVGNARRKVFVLVLALLIHYISDYTFISRTSLNIYVNGDVVDLLYATAAFVMGFGLINLVDEKRRVVS